MAASFVCIKGQWYGDLFSARSFVQAYWLTRVAEFPPSYSSSFQFIFGIFLFFAGMYINLDADSILRNLRRGPEDTGYYIPRVRFLAPLLSASSQLAPGHLA